MKDYPEVHLVNSDEQLAALRGLTQAVFEVDDVLSAAPSHWLDEADATNADHFYRCVILRGPMTVSRGTFRRNVSCGAVARSDDRVETRRAHRHHRRQ